MDCVISIVFRRASCSLRLLHDLQSSCTWPSAKHTKKKQVNFYCVSCSQHLLQGSPRKRHFPRLIPFGSSAHVGHRRTAAFAARVVIYINAPRVVTSPATSDTGPKYRNAGRPREAPTLLRQKIIATTRLLNLVLVRKLITTVETNSSVDRVFRAYPRWEIAAARRRCRCPSGWVIMASSCTSNGASALIPAPRPRPAHRPHFSAREVNNLKYTRQSS